VTRDEISSRLSRIWRRSTATFCVDNFKRLVGERDRLICFIAKSSILVASPKSLIFLPLKPKTNTLYFILNTENAIKTNRSRNAKCLSFRIWRDSTAVCKLTSSTRRTGDDACAEAARIVPTKHAWDASFFFVIIKKCSLLVVSQ